MNPETKRGLTTQEVAARFDQLAQQEKWFEIQDELFADNVRSIEPTTAKNLKNAEGKAAVRKKAEDLIKQVEQVHSSSTTAPVVAGNHFAVGRILELTVKGLGRIKMDEIMLYEVKEGQIVLEQFFYQASRPYRRPARRRTPADCYPLIAEAGKPLLPATGQRHALVMRKVEQLSNGRVNIGLRYR